MNRTTDGVPLVGLTLITATVAARQAGIQCAAHFGGYAPARFGYPVVVRPVYVARPIVYGSVAPAYVPRPAVRVPLNRVYRRVWRRGWKASELPLRINPRHRPSAIQNPSHVSSGAQAFDVRHGPRRSGLRWLADVPASSGTVTSALWLGMWSADMQQAGVPRVWRRHPTDCIHRRAGARQCAGRL